MSEVHLTREAYEELINQDIEWLIKNTDQSLERDHIISVLKDSVDIYYGGIIGNPVNEMNPNDKNLTICIDSGHGNKL
jgi:hypothetical protein